MKNNNFITIQGWMVNEIGLSGNELLLYALIYGFSQDEQNSFNLSLSYTMKWLNVSKPTVLGLLRKLIEKNLIEKKEKTENGVKFCSYRVVNNFNWGSKETLPPPSKETLPPYNIDIYNTLIIKYNNIKEPMDRWLKYKKERKEKYTDTGLEDCFEKLQKLSNGNKEIAIDIVKQSTSNNWAGLFPLKMEKNNQEEKKFLIEPYKFFLDEDEKYSPGYSDLVKQLPEDERWKIGEWITNKFNGQEVALSTIRNILTKAIQKRGL